MIRFHLFASDNEGLPHHELIQMYDKKHAEKSVEDKFNNVINALNKLDYE